MGGMRFLLGPAGLLPCCCLPPPPLFVPQEGLLTVAGPPTLSRAIEVPPTHPDWWILSVDLR